MEKALENIIARSLFSATVLFILTKAMGKKQISQLTLFDYVVGISIGSIAASISIDRRIVFSEGIISMVTWGIIPLLLSFISVHSIWGRRLLDGTPTILIQHGKIIEKNLRKAKLTINDLLEELRIKDVFNIADVEFALFETNGKISVLKQSDSKAQGLCANIIIDGKIMKNNLELINKNELWLMNELKKQSVFNVEEVLLACYDMNGCLNIDLKNQDPPIMNVLQ